MRFNCNKWGCSYFSDNQFEPDEFTLLGAPELKVNSEHLDEIKTSGKLASPHGNRPLFALAVIKCPECELMFFMPAKKALEEGLNLKPAQRLSDWEV
jgi:hypothetical protein